MLCKDLMRQPLPVCLETSTVVACARAMRERDLDLIPIVDEDGRLIGSISERDLVMQVLAPGHSVCRTVGPYVNRAPTLCRTTDSLADAEQMMAQAGLRRLIALDPDGAPAGLVCLEDIIRVEPDTQRVLDLLHAIEGHQHASL